MEKNQDEQNNPPEKPEMSQSVTNNASKIDNEKHAVGTDVPNKISENFEEKFDGQNIAADDFQMKVKFDQDDVPDIKVAKVTNRRSEMSGEHPPKKIDATSPGHISPIAKPKGKRRKTPSKRNFGKSKKSPKLKRSQNHEASSSEHENNTSDEDTFKLQTENVNCPVNGNVAEQSIMKINPVPMPRPVPLPRTRPIPKPRPRPVPAPRRINLTSDTGSDHEQILNHFPSIKPVQIDVEEKSVEDDMSISSCQETEIEVAPLDEDVDMSVHSNNKTENEVMCKQKNEDVIDFPSYSIFEVPDEVDVTTLEEPRIYHNTTKEQVEAQKMMENICPLEYSIPWQGKVEKIHESIWDNNDGSKPVFRSISLDSQDSLPVLPDGDILIDPIYYGQKGYKYEYVPKEGDNEILSSIRLSPQHHKGRIQDINMILKAVEDLGKAGDFSSIKTIMRIIRSTMFAPDTFVKKPKVKFNSSMFMDNDAQVLVQKYLPDVEATHVALKHDSQNLPMLSFVSMAMTGSVKYIDEFRLMMIRAMVKYRKEIETFGKKKEWHLFDKKVGSKAFDFLQEITRLAKKDEPIGLHGLYALTISLNIKIELKYPEMFENDPLLEQLNGTFCRESWASEPLTTIKGIWTDIREGATSWQANHIAYLAVNDSETVEVQQPKLKPKFINYGLSTDNVEKVLNKIMDDTKQVFPDIPKGPKSNVQMFVDNPNTEVWDLKKGNPKRYRLKNPKCDRGPWDKIVHKTEVFELIDGKLLVCEDMTWSNTLMKYIGRSSSAVVKDVDPSRSLFVVRRYYCTLGGNYSRHLLYFLDTPDAYKNAKKHVFVDYVGEDPRGDNIAYKRKLTNAITSTKLAKMIRNGDRNPKIFKQLDNPHDPARTLTNDKQVSNARYNIKKYDNKSKGNHADRVQKIQNNISAGQGGFTQAMLYRDGMFTFSFLFHYQNSRLFFHHDFLSRLYQSYCCVL